MNWIFKIMKKRGIISNNKNIIEKSYFFSKFDKIHIIYKMVEQRIYLGCYIVDMTLRIDVNLKNLMLQQLCSTFCYILNKHYCKI